jgi:hypothetical protein
MGKYKNKNGIQLSLGHMSESAKIGSGMDLVQEVVQEAVKLCSQYNWHDETSMRWALERTKDFLIENFDINVESKERSDEWRIEQFNRNRAPEDHVKTIEEMEQRVDEIFNS